MNFTLRQLQIFLAVVENGSALSASKKLNISQAAVSSAIAELESGLDVVLFDRWKKRMVINDRGRLLIPQARLILSNARELMQSFSDNGNMLSGTIRLGASRTISSYVIPNVLTRFVESHPLVKFETTSFNKTNTISKVEDFSLDIGIIAGECNKTDIQILPWMTDELCVFSSPNHPLAAKSRIAINDLSKCEWVVREEGSGTLEVFLNALPNRIKPLKTIMEFNNLESIKRTVEKGKALGCISKAALQRELDAGILKEIPTPFLNLRRNYSFLVHKNRRKSALINAFLSEAGNFANQDLQ